MSKWWNVGKPSHLMIDWRVKCLVILRMSAVTQSNRWQLTSVCATREPDAIDLSFERSLLHWCLSRLTSTLTHSSWHPTFSCQLLSEFDSDWLLRDPRSVQLLTLIELLSRGHRSVQSTPICEKQNGRKWWSEFIRTILEQANRNCPESAERIIRKNNRSQTSTTVSGYSRFELPPTLNRRHSQSMDQIWHATCGCLLSLFCEHQIH